MKTLTSLLTLSLLVITHTANSMEKPKGKKNSRKPPQTTSAITTKPQNQPKNEPTPEPPTSPAEDKMTRLLLQLTQNMEELRAQSSISAMQLDELLKISTQQEGVIKAQGEQIAVLLAITQRTWGRLYLPAPEQQSRVAQNPTPNSFATFTPEYHREWQGMINGKKADALLASPNHPRLSGDNNHTETNPWESPNHPKK